MSQPAAFTYNEEIETLLAHLKDRPWPPDFQGARRHYDSLGTPIPAEIAVVPVSADGVAARMLVPPVSSPERVVIFLHGGGYMMGSLASHGGMAAEIARASKSRVLQVDYRRSPEHPFPAPIEDSCNAYRWLLRSGYRPEAISIVGDSAGGGLTVATLVALRDAGDPLPSSAVCISPWTDLAFTGESFVGRMGIDPMVTHEVCHQVADFYLNGQDPRSPAASPLYADLRGLPPLLIQVGEREILYSDAERLSKRAVAAGVETTFEDWPGMVHVWHFFHSRLSDGRRAIARVGDFIIEHSAIPTSAAAQ